tara:strand:+ start:1792 stop:2007 length:216 start_codon:yes stop_codon:yes gene_type:complete
MARLTHESASAFIAREYDTLYLRGAVDISNNFNQSMKKHIPLLLPLALIFAALVATAKGETSYTVNMSGVT